MAAEYSVSSLPPEGGREVSGQGAEGLRLDSRRPIFPRTGHTGTRGCQPPSLPHPVHKVHSTPKPRPRGPGAPRPLQASCGTAASCPALRGALPASLSLEGTSLHASSSVYSLMERLKGSNDLHLYISGPQLGAGTEEVFNV